jgi:hypothetical protein
MRLGHKQFAALVCEQEPLLELQHAYDVRGIGGQNSDCRATNIHHTDDHMKPDDEKCEDSDVWKIKHIKRYTMFDQMDVMHSMRTSTTLLTP